MGDMPLQLYEFVHVDHEQRCPKFTESIRRAASPLQVSDIDELYTELETLLGAANIRMRRLESEAKILTDWCDKKDRKAAGSEGILEQFSNKRNRASLGDEKLSKKQKLEELKPGVSKGKKKQVIEQCDNISEDVEMYVSKPKAAYDAPNKFWSLVEPYCADLTMDDLNLLEDMIQNDSEDVYHVTPLGRHYTQRWLEEDMLEEQRSGSKAVDKRRTASLQTALGNNTSSNIDSDPNMAKKVQNIAEAIEDHCSLGMLTQRLVSALIDENIVTSFDGDDFNRNHNDDNPDRPETARSINVSNTKSLESAIKDELFNIGLIDSISDEESDGESEDEVLSELKRHQNELRAISAHNKTMSETLLANAKQEMKRQEYKQRIKAMDAEVMDAFRKITSAKQKKRIITKKERDQAWKAVRDREALLKLLDASE